MKYTVVKHRNVIGLKKLVEDASRRGWELQGGVSVAIINLRAFYCQAMVNNDASVIVDEEDAQPTVVQKIIGWVLFFAIIAVIVKLLLHFINKG